MKKRIRAIVKKNLVEFLPWDTNHFGYRIGRANIHSLDTGTYQQLSAACELQEIDCLYFLADADDTESILQLERQGFVLVDIRITFHRQLRALPALRQLDNIIMRSAKVDDLETLQAIAHDSFRSTRFFADPYLSDEKASSLYEIWLSKSVRTDYAERVLVAEQNGECLGFLTCHLDKQSHLGKIGLVALARSGRGKGISQGMIWHALHWFRDQGMQSVDVVTQGRNIAAQRLYQRCGFLTRTMQVSFHKWFRKLP